MKIILIHGIGDNNPGWSNALSAPNLLGISPDDVIEFNYEDLMETHWINRLLVSAARIAASYYAAPAVGFAANTLQDYVDDILSYFVVPGVRKKILARFAQVLAQIPDATIIAHSMGSIVAYEGIKNYPRIGPQIPLLITVGSPLGSPVLEVLVKKFLNVPDKNRPVVRDWFNFYSPLDPVGGKIDGLGCHARDQFKIRSSHQFPAYLKAIKRKLPSLFS